MTKCVEIRNGYYGIATYDKDGNEKNYVQLGKLIKLKKILKNIETNDIVWFLSFEYKGENVCVEFDRGESLDKNSIKPLMRKGADIKPEYINFAIRSIMMQEDSAPIHNTFSNVGWISIPDKNNACQYYYRGSYLVGNIGRYKGKYKLETMGDFESWRKMVNKLVLGRPALEVVLVVSLSAIVNGLIAPYTTNENPIFHLPAPSGTGKSTAGYVATSVYGEPFEGAKRTFDKQGNVKTVKSVFGSWNATENALITDNSGNQGMCVILNELGKYNGKDLTSVVYGLSDGVDKNRLDERYIGYTGENFCTSILSIGESSLIQRCKTKEGGIGIRVMEIDAPLTDNAEHSRLLKAESRKHNGWAALKLAHYIVDNGGLNFVLTEYQNNVNRLCNAEPNEEKHRYIEKFTALLLTTATLAREALDIQFNIETLVGLCDDCWKQKTDEDGGIHKSYYEVLEHLNVHIKSFYRFDDECIASEMWGRVTHPRSLDGEKVLTTEWLVRSNILKEIMQKMGYKNPTTCLKKWRDSGVLRNEKGKLVNRAVITPNSTDEESVYIIQVWQDKPKKIESEIIKNAKNAYPKGYSSNFKHLLS